MAGAHLASDSVSKLLGDRTQNSIHDEVIFPWTRQGVLGRNDPAAIASVPVEQRDESVYITPTFV